MALHAEAPWLAVLASSRAFHTNMIYNLLVVAAGSGIAHGIICRSTMVAGAAFLAAAVVHNDDHQHV